MKRKLSLMVMTLLVVALLNSMVMAATNQTDTVSVTLDAGELFIISNGVFGFDNVNLATQTYPGGSTTKNPTSVPYFTLGDYRGTAEGWHVTFQCDPLTNNQPIANTLDLGFDQNGSSMTKVNGQDIQTGAGQGPLIEDTVDVDDMNSDTMVINTNESYGMGEYTYTVSANDFDIVIEASNAFAGTYTSTFVSTIVSGPGGTGSWTGNVQ